VGFVPTDYTTDEGDGSVELNIQILEGTLERSVTVLFSTTDGSAVSTAPSNDFTAVSNEPIMFDSMIDTVKVSVSIVDDTRSELTESFYGNLSTSDGAVRFSPDSDSAKVDILEGLTAADSKLYP